MIRLTLFLATLAIALPFLISYVANPANVGIDVSERFLERSDRMPVRRASDDTPAKRLKYWVENKETANFARAYALRVIPFDLIYLFVLGGFLCSASIMLAPSTPLAVWFPRSFILVCCCVPVLYVFTDLVEDLLIIVLLLNPDSITDSSVKWLAGFRGTKLVSVTASIVQVIALAGVSRMSAV